jgi:sucrose-6-phosphate hydrolase SacC (GH32 family)
MVRLKPDRLLVDESSVEVFANDGEVTLSATTFPDRTQTGISFFAKGSATIKNFEAWELASIWNR